MTKAGNYQLERAHAYEQKYQAQISKDERPAFHLTPQVGWMNDPNGFSYYQGEYHLFYQYHPYKLHWDAMHWGHAKSKDLLNWEYLPAALAPDQAYDEAGCFSGSAIELDDGQILLMYTGVVKTTDEKGTVQEIQHQCIAIGDGVNFTKHPNNPVIPAENLPNEGLPEHFRDPKIFRQDDGTFACVIVNKAGDGFGQVLLYESPDAIHWNFVSVLAKNDGTYGLMWECPDFFRVDGKDCLILSPQDMIPHNYEYTHGNNTLAFIGQYNADSKEYVIENAHTLDNGIDYYAPQTCEGPDGQRILVAWMQNWDTLTHRDDKSLWFGQMCLPRELSIKNGRLYQMPIKTLDSWHRNIMTIDQVFSDQLFKFDSSNTRTLDLEMVIKDWQKNASFDLFLGKKADTYTHFSFDADSKLLTMDRSYSGSRRLLSHSRTCEILPFEGELKLRFILDRNSIEVFIQDGSQSMSTTIFSPGEANGLELQVKGTMHIAIEKRELVRTVF